jgi:hypothetical protein
MFSIPATGPIHHPAFTEAAGRPESYQTSIDCAVGMAVVACQILTDDEFAASDKKGFEINVPKPTF